MEYAMKDFIRGWSRRSENRDMPVALYTDILLISKASIVKTIIRLGFCISVRK